MDKHQTKEYKEGFKDGWLEVIGWLNGEVDVNDMLSDKNKRVFKSMLKWWMLEWKNSVKLK